MSYEARLIQIDELGEERCLYSCRRETADEAEDRVCEWANDRDVDNQYPESHFRIEVNRVSYGY